MSDSIANRISQQMDISCRSTMHRSAAAFGRSENNTGPGVIDCLNWLAAPSLNGYAMVFDWILPDPQQVITTHSNKFASGKTYAVRLGSL